ncbi:MULTISPECIES: DUF4058 family protein [unclassified Coleofasciculus]|uniref:DUF4058 family protein n=1 Tax=unclassified Coleofasciculus TaxID=2692782 RepID=UPI0018816389|nr:MULTISPECIES: DUF4058 family protein [unclassified Coleofasciculus]MBE9126920.1 DUF4058 family protein [Coleofasciculus sp. LEGE 07081]MBE9148669.1 DUF4058 family protein [Coleofasciculus sp. LEGE 07092]
MSSPFPGMNPYLENPAFWSEVHNRLIVNLADALAPQIPPQYRVAIEQRTYLRDESDSVLVGIPDVAVFSQNRGAKLTSSTATFTSTSEAVTVKMHVPENVKEIYLEIREVTTSYVVTVIEILSPKNKRAGEGRKAYERKRKQVLATTTHLVEIDLLRGGKPMLFLGEVPSSDYRIVVSRGDRRPLAQLYGFSVREAIPSFPLPLQSKDAEPFVDLQTLLNGVYERARYNLAIDYSQEPVPPLKEEDAVLADTLLREKGLRNN